MESKFLEIIKDSMEIEGRELSLLDKFKEYDEWDSLAQLTLIAELDDHFGVTIQSEDFKKIETLKDLLEYIEKSKT